MAAGKSIYYEPTKFKQNQKGVENYQTAKNETISYKNILHPIQYNAKLDHKAGSGKIPRQGLPGATMAHKLEEGEFAVVERKYAEAGMFDFTTRDHNKINSNADVAFIFRQLESEAVEHAFAVYVDKDRRPSVQWLSMGGINSTVVDPRLMVDAAQRLGATEIYFVHNHPSGSLAASRNDTNIFEKLKRGFKPMGIMVHAMIINLNSGNYLVFNETGSEVEKKGFTSSDFKTEEKVGVFCFNKQAFLQSPINKKICSPLDAAEFLSQQKFSSGEKAGYLLLTQKNEIVGNFFATQNSNNEAFGEVAGLVSKFGGVNVIAYTNKADVDFYQKLKADLHYLDINLHDVIECESSAFVCQTFEKYKSLAERGLLDDPQNNYKTNKSKVMNKQNTLREENLTRDNQLNKNEESFLQKNFDYLNNQIKYLGFGEGFSEALKDAFNSGNDKIDFPVSKEFFSPGSKESTQAVDFTLHLSKGKESDLYFLNSYSAQLKTSGSEMNQEQKFYLNRGKGFTAKEAFNLLSNRAVNKDLTNKEGETYNAWVKLKPSENNGEKRNNDFQIFNENYGFDLKDTLSKYPIKEMETPEGADRIMNSLKKGNTIAVIFNQNGEESQKFISANPQFKNLIVHNQDGSIMFHNNIELNKKEPSQKQAEDAEPSARVKKDKAAGIKR